MSLLPTRNYAYLGSHCDERIMCSLKSLDIVMPGIDLNLTVHIDRTLNTLTAETLKNNLLHYLKEIILRCTLNIQFCFNNNLYRQIDGVAMGSPLGPVLADCFMAKLENTVLSGAIKQLTFYSRFMDDTFIMCDNDVDIDKVLELFNTAHPSVSFTMSEEQNG